MQTQLTIKGLKDKAEKAKFLYKTGRIDREEAKKEIKPYIERFNERTKEIAKKYNQRPKTINLTTYLR